MIALRKTVIRMFEHALGSRNASTWTNEELAKKLETLPALTGTYSYPLRPDQVRCSRGGKYGIDIEQKPCCVGCPVSEWYVCDHKRQEIKTGTKLRHENDGLRVKVKDVQVKRFLERVFLAIRLKETFTVVNSKKRKRKLESKRKEIMTLTREQAVKLLVEMGYKTAGKWNTERIQKKVDSFAELAKEEEIVIEDEKMQIRFKRIVKALKNGKTVMIDDAAEVTDETSAKPTKKKKTKKSKKKIESDVDEDADEDADVDEGTDEEEAPTKKKKKAAKKSEKKEKSTGVIASILEFITDNGPINKAGILELLVDRFPDREEAAMAKTVQAQLPTRLMKDKNVKIIKDENKCFSIK